MQNLCACIKKEGLSFKNVVTFNLDEYYPIEKDAYQSYWSFMHRHLFDHVDIDKSNIHIPNGELPKEAIKAHCMEYEQMLEDAGGIDLQVLGIGNNGHIGFNEPGSSIFSKTRLINLDNSTRVANSREFPKHSKGSETCHNNGHQHHHEIKKNYFDGMGF
jgi:glucosamine-6-phosphate deaminase